MGDTESCSSNAGASRADGPTNAANSRKRKEVDKSARQDKDKVIDGPSRKKHKPRPLHSATSRNIEEILAMDRESLENARIPSPVRDVEPIQVEDDDQPSPASTKILESKMMSSTYTTTINRCPFSSLMYRLLSTSPLLKPCSLRYLSSLEYQALGACLSP